MVCACKQTRKPARLDRDCLRSAFSAVLSVSCSLQIQFDNRGSKVEGKKDTLIRAVAKMLKVDPKQISMNVIGQSGLLNHQVCLGWDRLWEYTT
jgi:hypothetical protein